MIKAILLSITLLFTQFTHAEEWSELDKKLLIASEVLLVADWMQTRQIVKNPDRYHETNPILGKHPSLGEVNTYFISCMVANYYLADWLGNDDNKRTIYLSTVTVVQGVTVRNNYLLGLRFAF